MKGQAASAPDLDDTALVQAILGGDRGAARMLMTANNQRLFRAAWSILKDRGDAEDAVQEGYLKAFAKLSTFKGEARLSTWLTRIVINEALGRRRAAQRRERQLKGRGVALIDDYRETLMRGSDEGSTPEQTMMRQEAARLLERAIARLPEPFRLVFVLREIEGLDVEETAQATGVAEATVKTRLHRAKARLRSELEPELGQIRAETLAFLGAECEALTARVLEQMTVG